MARRRRANGASHRRNHQAAFALRDAHITDPRHLDVDVQRCSPRKPCSRWPTASTTLRFPGAAKARAIPSGWASWITADWQCHSVQVSITSPRLVGSGVVLPRTPGSSGKTAGGLQPRPAASSGAGASQTENHSTLNPRRSLERWRVMVYGSMGGDGRPQTQAALFYILQGRRCGRASPSALAAGPHRGQSSDSLEAGGDALPPPASLACASWGTGGSAGRFQLKRWATPGPLSAIPTVCLEGATDPHAATAPPPDTKEQTMTTVPDWAVSDTR